MIQEMVLETGTELQSDHIGFSCEAPDKVPVRPSVRCSQRERTAATAVPQNFMIKNIEKDAPKSFNLPDATMIS